MMKRWILYAIRIAIMSIIFYKYGAKAGLLSFAYAVASVIPEV